MIYCVPPLLNYKVAYTTKLWRPQGQSLVSGAEDGVVRIWKWSKETTSLEMVEKHSVRKGRVIGASWIKDEQ